MSRADKYVPLEIGPTEDEARLRIRWKDGVASEYPEVMGTPAMPCAMITPNGLVPAVAQPMPYGTQIMPMATTASIFIASAMVTRIGISGRYSSPIPIVNEPRPNTIRVPAIRIHGAWPRRFTAP